MPVTHYPTETVFLGMGLKPPVEPGLKESPPTQVTVGSRGLLSRYDQKGPIQDFRCLNQYMVGPHDLQVKLPL